jgi:Protein of unknown function (DUF1091)
LFQLHVDLKHRSITPFFNQVINSTTDFCEFLNETKPNLVLKWVIGMAKEFLPPGFVHHCPYIGNLEAYNVSVTLTPEMSVFLTGRYLLTLRPFDDVDPNIFTAFIDLELRADLQKSKKQKKLD